MGKNKQMVSKLNKEILLKIKNKENVTELEFFLVKMLNTEFTKAEIKENATQHDIEIVFECLNNPLVPIVNFFIVIAEGKIKNIYTLEEGKKVDVFEEDKKQSIVIVAITEEKIKKLIKN